MSKVGSEDATWHDAHFRFVVAGTIVRNRGWILPRHLGAVDGCGPDEMFYLTGDNEDDTEGALLAARRCHGLAPRSTLSVLSYDSGFPGWRRDGTPRYSSHNMAFLRNAWARTALALYPQATHLWVVDSDVIPELDCLIKLLNLDKPVVAAHVPLMDGVTPIWMEGWRRSNDLPMRSGSEKERTDPQRCTLVGGCYLIRRDAWDAGLRWSPTDISEDGGFACSARDLGIEMWAHPGARTQHLMKEPV